MYLTSVIDRVSTVVKVEWDEIANCMEGPEFRVCVRKMEKADRRVLVE